MTMPDRFVAGAIDLGEVKARAEARAQASRQPAGSVAPTLTITQENFEHDASLLTGSSDCAGRNVPE